jgi:hypothetical protein
MPFGLDEGIARVRLGEAVERVRAEWRREALEELGMTEQEAGPETFRAESQRYARQLCRLLADRHPHDAKTAIALRDYVERCDDYDAYDALLATFEQFDGRARIVARGRQLFPGPLTAHW